MSTLSRWRRRQRTAMRVGGWTFVTVAVGHLVLAELLPSTGATSVIRRQMQQARVPLPPDHSYADLMQGFSLAMSVLLLAWGVSVLLTTRDERLPDATQVGLSLAVSLAMVAVAVALLPYPPIVLMSVASVAFTVAMIAVRRSEIAA